MAQCRSQTRKLMTAIQDDDKFLVAHRSSMTPRSRSNESGPRRKVQGMSDKTALVFGSTGAIGAAIVDEFGAKGFKALSAPRSLVDIDRDDGLAAIREFPQLDAVAWAQGITGADTIENFDDDFFMSMFNANCRFVAKTLQELLKHERLNNGSRLCVVSTIWQDMSRRERFSYSVTKAAVGGLVRSASIDLAERGILVNAVLPGSVDSPMGRRPGSSAQDFPAWTPHGHRLSVEDIARTVVSLCDESNTAVSGQSIPIDLAATVAMI